MHTNVILTICNTLYYVTLCKHVCAVVKRLNGTMPMVRNQFIIS